VSGYGCIGIYLDIYPTSKGGYCCCVCCCIALRLAFLLIVRLSVVETLIISNLLLHNGIEHESQRVVPWVKEM
jgi:hypothetical protein